MKWKTVKNFILYSFIRFLVEIFSNFNNFLTEYWLLCFVAEKAEDSCAAIINPSIKRQQHSDITTLRQQAHAALTGPSFRWQQHSDLPALQQQAHPALSGPSVKQQQHSDLTALQQQAHAALTGPSVKRQQNSEHSALQQQAHAALTGPSVKRQQRSDLTALQHQGCAAFASHYSIKRQQHSDHPLIVVDCQRFKRFDDIADWFPGAHNKQGDGTFRKWRWWGRHIFFCHTGIFFSLIRMLFEDKLEIFFVFVLFLNMDILYL